MEQETTLKTPFFKGDTVILILVFFFSIISILEVASSSNFILTQLFHLLVCYITIYFFYKVDYRVLSKFSIGFLLLAVVLLIWTLLTGGRSIYLLFSKKEVQTFYFIGFLVVFFISKYVANIVNKDESISLRDFIILSCIVFVFCAGMYKENLSTAIILFATCMVVFYVANIKLQYLLTLFLSMAIIGGSVMLFNPDVGRGGTGVGRTTTWIKSLKGEKIGEEAAKKYKQVVLAKAAIARSATQPTGPGQGVIKHVLVKGDTDYIYANTVEELGIGVGILIIILYLILFFRTMRIARQSTGFFGRILAVGIGFWFTCQALIHIGANCELIPTTGQTLPFISRSGSALIFSGVMIGVLLNISKKETLV
ncbi:MAG: FtsW/RodA/SpoVE family cell cycle protein [Bacteroidales bacterium]|jgi:cell division protein FtsW|nr:FtsW/RodA/SpoVE family cell cycle protein [Bacteroidales bacterium]